MAGPVVSVGVELGHEASVRTKRTAEGFTHDWEVFVRGADGTDISPFVERVVFTLHETFLNSRRVVREPPYSVRESGYAGFMLPIEIVFSNGDEPRRAKYNYDLTLQTTGPPISKVIKERITFSNPSEDLRRKLISAGGVGVPVVSEAPSAAGAGGGGGRGGGSGGSRAGGEPERPKAKGEKPPRDSFSDLFGQPIRRPEQPKTKHKAKHIPRKEVRDKPKKQSPSGSKRSSSPKRPSSPKKPTSPILSKRPASPKRASSPILSKRPTSPKRGSSPKRNTSPKRSSSPKRVASPKRPVSPGNKRPSSPGKKQGGSPTKAPRLDKDAKEGKEGKEKSKKDKKDKRGKEDRGKERKGEKETSRHKHKKRDKKRRSPSPPPPEEKKREPTPPPAPVAPPPAPAPTVVKPRAKQPLTMLLDELTDPDSSDSDSNQSEEEVKKRVEPVVAPPPEKRMESGREEPRFSAAYVSELRALQQRIMSLESNADLQQVVRMISQTGRFEITKKTFDFDLCALDRATVQRLMDLLHPPMSSAS